MSEAHHDLNRAAQRWFNKAPSELGERERQVLLRALSRKTVSHNTNRKYDASMSFGDRLADRVAAFGGSWRFIILFLGTLVVWVCLNLILAKSAFDPYPFIFLNLMLSMLAAFQAPVIMMSQNRQSARDRLDASGDYEVNLKAEIEIMALHDKLDQMRAQDLESLVRRQDEQIALLTQLLTQQTRPNPS